MKIRRILIFWIPDFTGMTSLAILIGYSFNFIYNYNITLDEIRLVIMQDKEMKEVVIYTDGACSGNPGIGGFGAIIIFQGKEKIIQGAANDTTNNQMELLAVCKALECLTEGCNVQLYTDSQYVKNGITEWIRTWLKNNWRTAAKKPVKNQNLWQRLLAAADKHEIVWHWVQGHSGDIFNERVDKIATAAIKLLTQHKIPPDPFES